MRLVTIGVRGLREGTGRINRVFFFMGLRMGSVILSLSSRDWWRGRRGLRRLRREWDGWKLF